MNINRDAVIYALGFLFDLSHINIGIWEFVWICKHGIGRGEGARDCVSPFDGSRMIWGG